jgi:D-lactate dehydrogenase (cytochrome)
MSLRPGSRALVTDVCVPISRLAECIASTEDDIERSGLVAPIVGHVGDGNFHLLVLVDPNDREALASAKAFHTRLVERAIALEGTCTGEHGIGNGKIEFLRQELGESVETMLAIKQALDPMNIMNPDKIFRSRATVGD